MVVREAIRFELELVPPGAEPEDQPAPADLVDGRGDLGEHCRVVEVRTGDQRAELDPTGNRRKRGERRPCLPWTLRLALGLSIEKVVADPERVEADLLGTS